MSSFEDALNYAPFNSISDVKRKALVKIHNKEKIEFAKEQVRKALESAANNAKWQSESYPTIFGDDTDVYDFIDTDKYGDPCEGYIISVDKDSILKSYSLEDIK